jgi:DNA-binding MarR family transcriptional regulator
LTLPLFDPQFQSGHLESRILVALERLSEVFRVLLWEAAWPSGLTPLQLQILLFCDGHRPEWCRVAGLAREFNLTRPTISDAVRALVGKGLLERVVDPADGRSHYLRLLPAGKDLALRSGAFAGPVWSALQQMEKGDQAQFYGSLLGLIDRLQQAGVISLSRMCFTCQHYRSGEGGHYCALLEKVLATADLRMDCPEHAFPQG